MKISIVIPAYNEEKRIGSTLEAYGKYFNNLKKDKKIIYELLIVINGTTDNTELIIRKLREKNKHIRYLNFRKGGKGFAVLAGFKDALKRKNDLIGFVDADMATSPGAFYDLVKNIGKSDGIIASRWIKGAKIKTPQTILRKLTSRSFNILVRFILGLNFYDTQCGAKLFTRRVASDAVSNVGTTKWAFDIDLLYQLKRRGYSIREMPTVWDDKKESKLNLTRVPLQMFLAMLRLRLLYSPLRFLVNVYDRLPETLKIHHK